MSDNIQRVFVKPPDFASVYADGVMFQKGSELCRLVFYQRGIEPTEDGSAMDKEREYITLNFEVKLPEWTLKNLAESIIQILEQGDKAWNMKNRRRKDEKVTESWYHLNKKIENFVYNTDEDEIDRKAVDDLNSQYDDLVGRVKGRPEVANNESDKVP